MRRSLSWQPVEMILCPLGWFPCSHRENFPTSWEHGKNHVHIFSTPASHLLRFREEEFNRLDRFIATGYAISLGNILVMGKKRLGNRLLWITCSWCFTDTAPMGWPFEGESEKTKWNPRPPCPLFFALSRVGILDLRRTGKLTSVVVANLFRGSQIHMCVYTWMSERVKIHMCIIKTAPQGVYV